MSKHSLDPVAIQAIILEQVHRIAEDYSLESLKNPQPGTVLYGEEGGLDSMGLVSLIADVEESVWEKTGHSIVLANERALSRKRSPFSTCEALSAYVVELLTESNECQGS